MKFRILILILGIAFSSCQKYLDIKRDTDQSFIETLNDCQLILNDYDSMNLNYPSDGQASSDDYYLGDNVFPGNYSEDNKNIYTWQPNAINTNDVNWSRPYNIIYKSNVVLQAIEKIDKNPEATWNNLRGSALFYRATAFWNLAQLYAKPYGSNTLQNLGIPLRTSPDLNDLFGRGTVKETYDRIIQDLEEAATLLAVTSPNNIASQPNKAAVYAMLARAYLSMEDYPRALTNANASLELKSDLLDYNIDADVNKTNSTPFARFNREVLFHSIMNSSTSGGTIALLDAGDAAGPRARVNPILYASYDANDWRKTVFFKENAGAFAGTFRFTGNYEPSSGPQLFNGLTTGEMYLTRAESYARSNKLPEALADLNSLLVKRFKTGTYTPLSIADPNYDTADEVLAKVLLERRKELVMRGQRWTDLRRLNKDTRFRIDLTRTVGLTTYTLPANDPRYTLLIPPNIIEQGGYPQNER